MLSRCFLDCSVGVGVFVTGLSQISSFFSCNTSLLNVQVYVSSDVQMLLSYSHTDHTCRVSPQYVSVDV